MHRKAEDTTPTLQWDEGRPGSRRPDLEGPRRPEGHRSGLGSSSAATGGTGEGEAGKRWRRVPGYSRVPGAGTALAGKGGERRLPAAHARWPPPSHHYLRAARRRRLLFLGGAAAGARARRALLAAGRGAGGRRGGGRDQARHAALLRARPGSASPSRELWRCFGRACAVAVALLRHPRPGLVGEAEGERALAGACEAASSERPRLGRVS